MHACRDVLCAVNTWTCHYIYPRYDSWQLPQPEVAAGHAATIQRLYGTARLGNADYPSSRDVPYMVLGAMENSETMYGTGSDRERCSTSCLRQVPGSRPDRACSDISGPAGFLGNTDPCVSSDPTSSIPPHSDALTLLRTLTKWQSSSDPSLLPAALF